MNELTRFNITKDGENWAFEGYVIVGGPGIVMPITNYRVTITNKGEIYLIEKKPKYEIIWGREDVWLEYL